MKSPKRLVALAHAKVNLDLRVLGTRADGFHELRTVFQTIELHDSLTCIEQPGAFTLRCRTPGVPVDDSNLVWRAAASLWKALGREGDPRDTVVVLEKTIPMESGLGGGSADAAAALVGLGRLWGGVPVTLLRDVAPGIGADVAFFLSGGTALGLGRGEEIYPAGRSSAALGRRRAAAVWRLDGGSVLLVRRGSDRGTQGDARTPDPAGAVAQPCSSDGQRPRTPGRPAPSRD